jgi:hypothetical protein
VLATITRKVLRPLVSSSCSPAKYTNICSTHVTNSSIGSLGGWASLQQHACRVLDSSVCLQCVPHSQAAVLVPAFDSESIHPPYQSSYTPGQ